MADVPNVMRAMVLTGHGDLEKLREAQQAFIDKRHVGNIVVTMDD